MRGNITDHKVHIMAPFGQRTCKPDLRKWHPGDRVNGANNTDLHLDQFSINESTVFPIL